MAIRSQSSWRQHRLHELREVQREEDAARALVWFGLILDAQSRTAEARVCFVEALDIFRRVDNVFWIARAATNLGRCLARLVEFDRAVEEAVSTTLSG
jgi:tetratricopeptide repeat protein